MIRTCFHGVNVNLVQLCEGGLKEDLGGFYGIRGVGVKSYFLEMCGCVTLEKGE
jgi:hypothetical protein